MKNIDVQDQLSALERRVSALEAYIGTQASEANLKERRLSPKEFLLSRAANSEAQKVLALAYFLEHFEGMISFNVADLDTAFRAAREKPPKNINDAVNKNVARGLLMEAKERKDSKKAWQLTATGEQLIQDAK